MTRGESVFSNHTAETYVEQEPSVKEWVSSVTPTKHDVVNYLWSLIPFTHWILHYNLQWLVGDLIAGITVGAVVVPQGMAYAKLALLPVQYGLYSSFVGVMIYWFFATSKDITIGPVAVMSTLTGNIITQSLAADPNLTPEEVASALALICGCIVFALGIFRLGFIVDFIPLPAITAFMTGSALNIAMGQIPTMMGITGFNTRDPTYLVLIHTLQNLGGTTIDAAMGLTALFALYLIRWVCTRLAKRNRKYERLWFFVSTLRTVFIMLLYTLVSWLVNRSHPTKPTFAILQNVPRGFTAMGVPVINTRIVSSFATQLPSAVIVLLIEHIAISKSFGRVNGYTIQPSQELIAIGITNIFGPFFGAYPATGSFSRTAIKSKAGVRTPFAGLITGIVVLLALYALPPLFYYIPSASLAAVIIHAVGDLITPPATIYKFWRISPLEVLIYFAGVIVTVFSSIENGIYVTVAVSGGLMLFRIAKAKGHFMGKVPIQTVMADDANTPLGPSQAGSRNIFLPIDHDDGSNPLIPIEQPYPGVFVFRFSEGLLYPNANYYTDKLVDFIFATCRRTDLAHYPRKGDRPWNDPGPRNKKQIEKQLERDKRPTLRAVVLDFNAVNNIDITSIQTLIDVRNQLDRYASPEKVEWHFANVRNTWAKRALASAGFGKPFGEPKYVFSISSVGYSRQAFPVSDKQLTTTSSSDGSNVQRQQSTFEKGPDTKPLNDDTVRHAFVSSVHLPWIHTDLDEALLAVSHFSNSDTNSDV